MLNLGLGGLQITDWGEDRRGQRTGEPETELCGGGVGITLA